jgi:hypothetical protein
MPGLAPHAHMSVVLQRQTPRRLANKKGPHHREPFLFHLQKNSSRLLLQFAFGIELGHFGKGQDLLNF